MQLTPESRLTLVYPAQSLARHPYLQTRIEALYQALSAHWSVERVGRDDFTPDLASRSSLVIVAGGDGTTLAVAHQVTTTPLLSLRLSDDSVGYLCTDDAANAKALVEKLRTGACHVVVRPRLQLLVNGQPIGAPAYNDILLAHPCPARASRYAIHLNGQTECHCSSGIWIATAVGSHAAARAAGAHPLPNDDPHFMYRVREFCFADVTKPTLEHVFLPDDSPEFVITSHSLAFGDGDLWHTELVCGDKMRVTSATPLNVVQSVKS